MFKKILIPIDLTESAISKPALDASWSSGFRRRAPCGLHRRNTAASEFHGYVPPEFDKTQEERALQALQQISAALLSQKTTFPCRQIRRYLLRVLAEADEWNADLIVIGSHRPSMATYLIGSNAKTIVRTRNARIGIRA